MISQIWEISPTPPNKKEKLVKFSLGKHISLKFGEKLPKNSKTNRIYTRKNTFVQNIPNFFFQKIKSLPTPGLFYYLPPYIKW
jgi:hypothetical protein